MFHPRSLDPFRDLLALDERIQRAQALLQQMSEGDPAFERRVDALVHLVETLDRIWGQFLPSGRANAM